MGKLYRGVEQLVARWAHIRRLADTGSSPVPATKTKAILADCLFYLTPLALMLFHVYVLFSPTFNKIYIGFSSDLEGRLLSHNFLATKGWTVKFRPWTLVHTESFLTKVEAMKREKELKSAKGREYIRKQILFQ